MLCCFQLNEAKFSSKVRVLTKKKRHQNTFSSETFKFKSYVAQFSLSTINHLKHTGHVMHQQFNIQQLYILPTLYLCVLYLSENKQRLVPLTA